MGGKGNTAGPHPVMLQGSITGWGPGVGVAATRTSSCAVDASVGVCGLVRGWREMWARKRRGGLTPGGVGAGGCGLGRGERGNDSGGIEKRCVSRCEWVGLRGEFMLRGGRG